MKFAGIMIDANGTDRQRTAGHTKWHTDGPQGLWLNAKLWEPSLTAPDTRRRDRTRQSSRRLATTQTPELHARQSTGEPALPSSGGSTPALPRSTLVDFGSKGLNPTSLLFGSDPGLPCPATHGAWSDYYPRGYRCAIALLVISQVDELTT